MVAKTRNYSKEEYTAGFSDWYELAKPRVMSLALFTAAIGYIGGGGFAVHPFLAIISIIAIALGAGAAGSFNQWFERNSDALMHRTRNRPIASGLINADDGLAYSLGLFMASVGLLSVSSNLLAVFWYVVAFLYYAVFYTILLKTRTPQNIVIGGVAGGLPPLIGWAAASGSLSFSAFALVLVISVWTPSHFWALAIITKEDYARAKIPMYPNVYGDKKTIFAILVYAIILVPVAALPLLGSGGFVFPALAVALSLWFAWECYRLYILANKECAKRVFLRSIMYLFILFTIYGVAFSINFYV